MPIFSNFIRGLVDDCNGHNLRRTPCQIGTPEYRILFFCFRYVKEEINDDTAVLPEYNGRVVSWVSLALLSRCSLISGKHQFYY